MIRIGCHVGMKAPDYLLGSVKEALSYEANALMVYTGAPQNSKRIPTDRLKIDEARTLMEENGIIPEALVVHAPYIINLANSVKPETAEFGIEFLVQELERANTMGARYVVLHPGAHMKAGPETGIEWIANGLNAVFSQDTSGIMILLETMAGKGSEVGWTFEELRAIMDKVEQTQRLGVCLDTCHIHDAGMDVTDFDAILEDFDKTIGLSRLKVIHVNDSKNVRGARKDRHANIGQGEIGFEPLARVVHHPLLENCIKILETPYIEKKPPYKEEIEQLRNWKKSGD